MPTINKKRNPVTTGDKTLGSTSSAVFVPTSTSQITPEMSSHYAIRALRASMSAAQNRNWFKSAPLTVKAWTNGEKIATGMARSSGGHIYIAVHANTNNGTITAANAPTSKTLGFEKGADNILWMYWGPVVTSPNSALAPTLTINGTSDATLTKKWSAIDPTSGILPAASSPIGVFGGTLTIVNQANGAGKLVGSPNFDASGNQSTTGTPAGSFEFLTDAPLLEIQWYGPLYDFYGLSIDIDGEPLEVGSHSQTTNTTPGSNYLGSGFFKLDFTQAGGRKERRIRVTSGQGSAGNTYTIKTAPTDSVWFEQRPSQITITATGDSTTDGGASTPYGTRFHTLRVLGALIGQDNIINKAKGGIGYVNAAGTHANNVHNSQPRFDDMIAAGPELMFEFGIHNDVVKTSAERIAAVTDRLTRIRAAKPTCPVIWFGSTCLKDENLANLQAADDDLKTAITAFGDKLVQYIPVSRDPRGPWMTGGAGSPGSPSGTGNGDFYVTGVLQPITDASGDGHRNLYGDMYIAQRYAQALRTVIGA